MSTKGPVVGDKFCQKLPGELSGVHQSQVQGFMKELQNELLQDSCVFLEVTTICQLYVH